MDRKSKNLVLELQLYEICKAVVGVIKTQMTVEIYDRYKCISVAV